MLFFFTSSSGVGEANILLCVSSLELTFVIISKKKKNYTVINPLHDFCPLLFYK